MPEQRQRQRKALVVGAGPVGALTALSLHRRGWDVEVWESREDPRGQSTAMANLRSINLNISSRGLEALRSVDPSLAEMFLAESIPMKGRMIHHPDPSTPPSSQLYDPKSGQTGHSLGRPILNQRLVEALPPAVRVRFQTKLARLDLHRRLAWGVGSAGGKSYTLGDDKAPHSDSDRKHEGDTAAQGPAEDEDPTGFDLVVGADGSWSRVRQEMMRVERMDFSQSFIQHAYIELHMPPDPSKPGGFAIDPNHLHIWPRHAFMLIALPNKRILGLRQTYPQDGSFTLTLFLPFAALETLKTRDAAAHFFRQHFASAVDIVGEKRLVDDFESNPRGNLVTTHVYPTAWSSHAILLGDASHSMVPFYGQGLNCGLEDVRVFNAYLEKYHVGPHTPVGLGETDEVLEEAIGRYAAERDEDLRAICELAMQNYVEMRSKVLSPLHTLRRSLDTLLSYLLPAPRTRTTTLHPSPSSTSSLSLSSSTPNPHPLSLTDPFPGQPVRGWSSLYELVTFRADVGYAAALRRERWQARVVERGVWAVAGLAGVGVGVGGWALVRYWSWRVRR